MSTCQVVINYDKFGMACESHECGKPAVDYYVSDQGEEFWQCEFHDAQHKRCWGGSCIDYCVALDREDKEFINEARRIAGMPLLYDRNGKLARAN